MNSEVMLKLLCTYFFFLVSSFKIHCKLYLIEQLSLRKTPFAIILCKQWISTFRFFVELSNLQDFHSRPVKTKKYE